MSLNKWFGMGRITRDLEKKVTPSGVSVMNFTIAVDDDYKPKDGGEKRVAFVDCVAWRANADFMEKYCAKGRNVVVIGSWWPEKWTDKDGNSRTSWKVQAENIYFADSKPKGEAQGGGGYSGGSSFSAAVDASEGDLPF